MNLRAGAIATLCVTLAACGDGNVNVPMATETQLDYVNAAHESLRTAKLYGRQQDEISLDKVERILIRPTGSGPAGRRIRSGRAKASFLDRSRGAA